MPITFTRTPHGDGPAFMPDWRNADTYSYTDGIGYKAWAWEFLRRNADYRDDWSECQGDMAKAARRAAKFGLITALDPNAPACREDGVFLWWSKKLVADHVVALNRGWIAETLAAMPLKIECLTFDVSKPVDQQLKAARALLRKLKRARKSGAMKADTKAHKKLWKDYLRALDARNAGEPLKEIACVLFGHPAKVNKAADLIRQAKRLRDGGYRKIIALD